MTIEIRDSESMRQLRARREEGGGVFRVGDGLAVLDPHAAQEINAANYADVTLPDRLVDLLRGRKSKPISWKEVRAAWGSQLMKLAVPEQTAALDDRLRSEIDERLDREIDLPWAIQEIFTRALIPTIIANLSPSDVARLVRDQDYKLARLMRTTPRDERLGEQLRSALIQIRAGWVARRELRGRARGRRPRQLDLTDPIVEMLPVLGMDRAAYAVTTVLTAVSGPPGAVAVCMMLELARRPAWAARLEAELAAIPEARFHEAAVRVAPITYRFVKETLRMWSSPLVLTRVARTPLTVRDEHIDVDRLFHISPYFAHHSPHEWDDPDTFDPDRWLPKADRGPAHPCAYAPFGWAPTTCVGAGLGLTEMMLLCRLFSTHYRIEAIEPEKVEVVMASVPLPVGFRGVISRRS